MPHMQYLARKDYVNLNTLNEEIEPLIIERDDNGLEKMALGHFRLAFAILALGILICTLVFMREFKLRRTCLQSSQ